MNRPNFLFADEAALQASLAFWKRLLRLEHWDVTVKIVPDDAMTGAGHQGECEHQPRLNYADIRLLAPADYDCPDVPQDHEVTLVHELLHLQLYLFHTQKEPYDIQIEQAIHATSRALVSLRRAAEKEVDKTTGKADNGRQSERSVKP